MIDEMQGTGVFSSFRLKREDQQQQQQQVEDMKDDNRAISNDTSTPDDRVEQSVVAKRSQRPHPLSK